jgi:hypothetical protein
MKINNILYFAPGIGFSKVDIDGPELPDQFKRRVNGFYIEPAQKCVECGYAFAAGVLLVSCIDALARIRFGGSVAKRFGRFTREQLQSFSSGDLAGRFYKEFRNGLVHEGRVKNGGQFSLDIGKTVLQSDGILVVNPKYLAQETSSSLNSYIDLLQREDAERQRLADMLRNDHSEDFRVAAA